MRGFKISVMIAAFVAVVAVGAGLRHFYAEKRVIDPLSREASALPGVAHVEIIRRRDGLVDVNVALADPDRIGDIYPKLETMARQILGGGFGAVVIQDRPSPRLEQAYHRIHYAVHEALLTGRFAWMAEAVERELQREGDISYRVTVGDRHLFITLRDGESELIRVIPRPQALARDDGEARRRASW